MLRISVLALSAVLVAGPALAQSTSFPVINATPSQAIAPRQPLLVDDGTNAMAQTDGDNTRNDEWLGIGMFAIPAGIIIALGIQAQNKKHATSP